MLAGSGCFILAEAAINDVVPRQAERHSGKNELARLYWDKLGEIHASISPYINPVNLDNWESMKEHILTFDGWGIVVRLSWKHRSRREEIQLPGRGQSIHDSEVSRLSVAIQKQVMQQTLRMKIN